MKVIVKLVKNFNSPANLRSIVPNPFLTTRRHFLASAAASSAAIVGCGKSSDIVPTQTAAPEVRRDVPLRVLLCGDERWAEVLKMAWSAIADQPLQISVFDSKKINADAWPTKVLEAMKACDVAIVPIGLLPALDAASAITPPTDDLFAQEASTAKKFFPVLREGAMKFGGRTVAVPLGAVQPSLVLTSDGSAEDLEVPKDWEAYIAVAKKLNESRAGSSVEPVVAEPLTDGAAAQMFLWRANSANPPVWLFDRVSFAPVIDTAPYVETLELMKRCVELYGSARLNAGDVWSRVATGKLRMAIAWPATHSTTERIEEAVNCAFAPLPVALSASTSTEKWRPTQTLVSAESPVAIISSQCRQSIAAKRFLNWMVGGDGTSMVRSVVTGLTDLRRSREPNRAASNTSASEGDSFAKSPDNEVEESGISSYGSVLAKSLSSLSMRTPLQVLEYRKYAESLDAAVLSCLDGKQSAQDSLTNAAKKWTELTDKIGIKEQSKAWRKAQGLRS